MVLNMAPLVQDAVLEIGVICANNKGIEGMFLAPSIYND